MDDKLFKKFKEIANEKYKRNLSDSEIAELVKSIQELSGVIVSFSKKTNKKPREAKPP